MSMDLAVWSSREFELPATLPEASAWQRFGEELSYEGDGWQVLVLAERGEAEPSVAEVLPGAELVAYVTLEPLGATADGYAFLEKVVRSLARETRGVWVDPQGSAYRHDEGTFE